MKSALYGVLWLLVAAIAFSLASIIDTLPVSNEGLASKAYESWAGIIKIWCCSGWKPGNGSFTPWLNKVSSRFEKRHAGVRVQVKNVDGDDIAEFRNHDIPPDIILFAPGEISGEALLPLEACSVIREELKSTGQSNDVILALPVAMGGYAWAINTSLIDDVPYDWSETDDLAPNKSVKRYIMDIPADSRYYCWSAALNALMTPRRIPITGDVEEYEEIDVGLTAKDEESDTELETQIVICRLPKTLRDDFRTRESVYGDFTLSRTAAIPVTQFEIRNLSRLSQSGKGVSWAIKPGGGSFTDQLLFAAATDCEGEDIEARRALSKEFIAFMLNDDSQKELASIRAFSVTNASGMYSGQYGMAELEKILAGNIAAPNAFDGRFREKARAETDRLINR